MSDRKSDEALAAEFLTRHGLDPRRLLKATCEDADNPDFEVFKGGALALFCEVKTDDEDEEWLRKLESTAPMIEHLRDGKYTFNRFTTQIYKAVKQFDAVNPHLVVPNVLVFVNHNEMCRHSMLIGTLTGNLYTDSGRVLSCFKKYSEGRIKDDKTRIHLFVWLDYSGDMPDERMTLNRWDTRFYGPLCRMFSVDKSEVHSYNDQQPERFIRNVGALN